jgi:hypothetical protein
MSDIYDGAWRLLDHDPETGRTAWVLHDGDKMHFRVDYPVSEVLRANHEEARDADGKRWGEFQRVASIPLNLFHQSGFAEAQNQHDEKWLRRWLNDSDNRAWRTKEGVV